MKRKLLLVFSLFLGLTAAHAQQQFATLQHGDSVSVYYGYNALNQAHNAAVNGDVITLSPGPFYTVASFTKAVTLRGAGMRNNPLTGTICTRIINRDDYNNSVTFNIADDSINHLQVEGIYFSLGQIYYRNLKNAQFTRCQFESTYFDTLSGQNIMTGCSFANCIFSHYFRVTIGCQNNGFYNSVLSQIIAPSSNDNYYVNCIIGNSGDLSKGIYSNCVINYSSSNSTTAPFCNKCVIVCSSRGPESGQYSNKIATQDRGNNYVIVPPSSTSSESVASLVFKTLSFYSIYELNALSTEMFELTDAAAAAYLGTDSTQVGVYGGIMPFYPHVANYRVTAPQKSNSEGKLNVEIENVNEQ